MWILQLAAMSSTDWPENPEKVIVIKFHIEPFVRQALGQALWQALDKKFVLGLYVAYLYYNYHLNDVI